MKKIFSLLFVVCVSLSLSKTADAQWVTIPDSNFVNYLHANLYYSSGMNSNQMDTTYSGIVNETSFSCQNLNISDLTGIRYFDNLIDLHCEHNLITSLPILPSSLQHLWCDNNQIPALSNIPNSLTNLHCTYNLLTSIPILPSGFQALTCSHNQINNLPLLPNNLLTLYCNSNQLTSLPALPSTLKIFYCNDNLLTFIPELPDSLNFFDCSNNLSLTCLPQLKKFVYLTFYNTGISCLPNYPLYYLSSNPSPASYPLCNLYNNSGCPSYWNVAGSVYQDTSNDCIHQSNENSFNQVKINLKQGGNLIQQEISNTGLYSFDTYLNTYQVEIDTTNFHFTTNCFSNGSNDTAVNVTALDSLIYGVDFGMHCKPGFDVGANSIAIDSGSMLPNHVSLQKIHVGDMSNFYGAHCAAGVGGSVVATFNGPVTYSGYKAGSLAPTNVSGNIVTWNVADFGNVNFNSDFHLRFHTDTSAQIGQQVCFTVSVTPTAGDNDTTNNTWSGCFNVQTSFDPNEKEVSPIGNIDSTQKWLTYTIHFQNTGTATAQHIYVDDTLDTDLDESSFQLLSYSVAPFVQIKGNAVRFNFPNINLPDSNANEPASHGYVQYRIKPKHNLAVGTNINNTAFIYFDFNPAVVTNTALNVVTLPNGVNGFSISDFGFRIYPNPAGEKLMVNGIIVNGKETKISITDLFGREIESISTTKSSCEFNIANLSSGIYFVTVKSKDGIATEKFVKN